VAEVALQRVHGIVHLRLGTAQHVDHRLQLGIVPGHVIQRSVPGCMVCSVFINSRPSSLNVPLKSWCMNSAMPIVHRTDNTMRMSRITVMKVIMV
jgi:hypothetical protein